MTTDVRSCPSCGAQLVRQPGEDRYHFKRRIHCDRACRHHRETVRCGTRDDLTLEEIERFWSRVGPPTVTGCRLWTKGFNNKGYGRFVIYPGNNREKRLLAHRVSFMLTGHELRPDQELLHSCDTPPCVEPAHLRPGTHAENMRDSVRKGRASTPPPMPIALTLDQVEEIRRLYSAGGTSQKLLAISYGVSAPLIHRVVHGRYALDLRGGAA